MSIPWKYCGTLAETTGGAGFTKRCGFRLPSWALTSWCEKVGDGVIDGKPIELDESSEGLVEKGLIVVMEFNRTRVFDNSEVGDEANATSSEVFLIGLGLRVLSLT
jgi:hypothetical protein